MASMPTVEPVTPQRAPNNGSALPSRQCVIRERVTLPRTISSGPKLKYPVVRRADLNLFRPLLFRQTLLNRFEILESVLDDRFLDISFCHHHRRQENCRDGFVPERNSGCSLHHFPLCLGYTSFRRPFSFLT